MNRAPSPGQGTDKHRGVANVTVFAAMLMDTSDRGRESDSWSRSSALNYP